MICDCYRLIQPIIVYLYFQKVEPETTTFGDKCIDYMWFTPNFLGVSGVLQIPDNYKEIKKKAPGSCEAFGSDHISLKTEFYFS